MGMPGMHGMAYNNLAIDQADLLIGLGMRFDDRVTGRLRDFAPNAQVIHVDVDASELDKNVKATVPVVGDLKKVLNQLIPLVQPNVHLDWHRRLDQLKAEHPSLFIRESEELLPQYVLNRLSEVAGGDCIVVTGVGQHQMWAAQHCKFKRTQHAHHLRRLGFHGLRGARRAGRAHGPPRQDGLVGGRRRRFSDDHVRPRHRRREQRGHQVRHPK